MFIGSIRLMWLEMNSYLEDLRLGYSCNICVIKWKINC